MPRKPPDRSVTPLDLIDTEIIQEQAHALGRLGRGLEAALGKLRDLDATLSTPPSEQDSKRRAVLVAEAGYALWLFVVQREACGLRARLRRAGRGAGPHGPAAPVSARQEGAGPVGLRPRPAVCLPLGS
jgi:hypothetical protein